LGEFLDEMLGFVEEISIVCSRLFRVLRSMRVVVEAVAGLRNRTPTLCLLE
jgi:hypothetical protein